MRGVSDDNGIGIKAKGSIYESSSDMNGLYEIFFTRGVISK